MRHAFITTILALAACGPTIHTEPDPELEPMAEQDGSSTGEEPDGYEESGPARARPEDEPEAGSTSGGDLETPEETGDSSTGEEPAADCILPSAGMSACEATVEAGEAIGCAKIGGSCWSVVAAQYFLGDPVLAEQVSECEGDCDALEDECAFIPAGVPPLAVCHTATVDDCVAASDAAGIPYGRSVRYTCEALVEVFG